MKIERKIPVPPPEFTMTFSRDDGWTIVGALRLWWEKHPQANRIEDVKKWSDQLDAELRRGL